MTVHIALKPHEPGHGSRHLLLIQALLLGHSELMEHSGRQFGGEPIYVDKHEQEGDPLISRHCENGPQGDGLQGSR
jgi:hypothetical protein